MQEKVYNVRNNCSNIGIIAMFITMILVFVLGNSVSVIIARIGIAVVGLIVYAIKLGAEIVNNETFGFSITLVLLNVLYIVCNGIILVFIV